MRRSKATKYCPKCKRNVPIGEWTRSKHHCDGLSGWCKMCHNKVQRDRLQRIRIATLNGLGGKCVRCGFTDWRALQIDHLKGDGYSCPFRSRSTSKPYYDYVLAHPCDFQVLCANCNAIKRHENGEHGSGGRPRSHPPMTVAEYIPGPGRAPWLNADQVCEIRRRIQAGELLKVIARDFGIHESTVSRIKQTK